MLVGHRRASGKARVVKIVTPSLLSLAAALWVHHGRWCCGQGWAGWRCQSLPLLLGLSRESSHDSAGALVLVLRLSLLLLTALAGSPLLSVGSPDCLVDDEGDILDAVGISVDLGGLGTWIRALALECLVLG